MADGIAATGAAQVPAQGAGGARGAGAVPGADPDSARATGLGTAPGAGPSAGPGSGAGPGAVGGPAYATAGDVLGDYLRGRATAFLRALGPGAESGPGSAPGPFADGPGEAGTVLRGSARRIAGVLHVYAPLTEASWAEPLRTELRWLAGTLSREAEYPGRLARLLEALRRLSAGDGGDGAGTGGGGGGGPAAAATPLGVARAAALLERQLTLARTRAHSAALQALESARFHALADAVAVLASEVPLTTGAAGPAGAVLPPLAARASGRLAEAVAALPLRRAADPYNAEAVRAALGADLAADLQDAPWHRVRVLLRLSRYAEEVAGPVATGAAPDPGGPRLAEAAAVLRRHHEAAEGAAAVGAAARTPRIAAATAYALGVLHAEQRHEVEAARFAFSQVWPPASVPAP